MSKISWKPGVMLAPVPPALVSCGNMDQSNLITIAWSGVIASEPPMTYVSVRKERYSHEIISETKEFVINLTALRFADKTDFCGVKSGRDIDKFEETGLTKGECPNVSCPMVVESPVSIECKVTQVIECGSHDMFMAEIVGVIVDDKFIDENGKFCMEKTGLVAYAHGNYYTLGRELGKYGFSVDKTKSAPFYQPKSERMQKRRDDLKEFDRKRSFGDRPRGDRPFGDRPRGDRSFGDRPRGDRSFGDRPRGDRPFGDRKPRGEFKPRDRDGERREFKPRDRDGERREFKPRDGDGERKSFGDRKPFEKRDNRDFKKKDFGDKKPYRKKEEPKGPLSMADIKKKRKVTTVVKKD